MADSTKTNQMSRNRNSRSKTKLETDSEILQIDENFVNDDATDDYLDSETGTRRMEEMIHIQGRTRLGERRQLTISESKLYKRLNVATDPSLGRQEYKLICIVSILIIFTFTARIILTIKVYFEPDKNKRPESVDHLMEMLIDPSASSRNDQIDDINQFRFLHVILAALSSMLFLPFLFLLGLIPEGRMNLIAQMVMSIIVIGISVANESIQRKITLHYNETYSGEEFKRTRKRSENHASVSTWIYVGVLAFVLSTMLRILFRTKLKKWLVNFKIIGFYINFFTSRTCRDFLSLAMLLFLSFTVVSGSCLYKKITFQMYKDYKVEIILDAFIIALTICWLLLLFWIYSQVHHRYTHTLKAETKVLDEELRKLGKRHEKTLLDKEVGSHAYCPMSRNPDRPVNSGQNVPGQILKNRKT